MDRKSLIALVHVTAILVVQRCTWHQNRGICKVNSENQGLDSVGLKETHLSQYAKKFLERGDAETYMCLSNLEDSGEVSYSEKKKF